MALATDLVRQVVALMRAVAAQHGPNAYAIVAAELIACACNGLSVICVCVCVVWVRVGRVGVGGGVPQAHALRVSGVCVFVMGF